MFFKSVSVLMYHRVNPAVGEKSLVISPEAFKRQFEWLERNGFEFISLDDFVSPHRGKRSSSRRVALTFDDGFRDNLEHAFSLLVSKGKKAALFVVVDWVDRKEFLTWAEIRWLAERGITIGSHTLTHRPLCDITDERELEREIVDSKKRIEDRIGRAVIHFAYPVGVADQRVAEAVCRAGYRMAWVAATKPSAEIRNPLYAIRRIKVTPRDSHLFFFSLKALGLKSLFWKSSYSSLMASSAGFKAF